MAEQRYITTAERYYWLLDGINLYRGATRGLTGYQADWDEWMQTHGQTMTSIVYSTDDYLRAAASNFKEQ